MPINDQIKDEKLHHDINREATKIFALSSEKLHKYDYLTGEDILPSNQQPIIEQTKFTYPPLGKVLDKQVKTIEEQGDMQVKALDALKSDNKKLTIDDVFPKNAFINKESEKKFEKIKNLEDAIDRKDLVYKAKEKNDFRKYQRVRAFGEDIYNGTITLEEADNKQSDLMNVIINFNYKARPKTFNKKQMKKKYSQ